MTRLFDLTPPQPSPAELTCPACGVTERNEFLFRINHGFSFDQPERFPTYHAKPGMCTRQWSLWYQEQAREQRKRKEPVWK
jgi:hypothetical protein